MKRVGLIGVAVLTLTIVTIAVAATSGWKVQRSPNPRGAMDSQLFGVSCASSSTCTAVGQYNNGSAQLTLAERWNGQKWSLRATPSPSATSNDLAAVWCAAANRCMAVGSFQHSSTIKTLAERWNGKKWSIVHTPNPSGSPTSGLDGIACSSAKACTAVGSTQTGSIIQTLVERWNGKRWMIQTSPTPAGAALAFLNGVSCVSRLRCTAVGDWQPSSGPAVTFAERWNGKKWSIQHTAKPSGATSSDLSSISCTAPAACTAVGHYENSSTKTRTLAERWNGKRWSIQETRNPTSDPNKLLYDVSCTSAKSCTAAGETEGEVVWQATLVEHWNGSKWTVDKTRDPGTDNDLDSLSCTSTSTCTAVGWYEKNNSSPDKTLVEHR